jgi:ABC-type amino acid transport system permease subunit
MSLKIFHIVFIILSILLAFGFAAWEVKSYANTGEGLRVLAAVVSLAVGVYLILYAIRFVRKLKSLKSQ